MGAKDKILWRGGWPEVRHPFQAFFCAPLFSLLVIAGMALVVVVKGLFKAETFAWIGIVSFYTLAFAYGVTLVYGVPIFLYLSRHKVAGLIPTIIAGIVPGMVLWIGTRGAYFSDIHFLVSMSLTCGVLTSAGYWWIVRRPDYKGLHS